MDVSNSGGNVWMVNGRPIAGWCRKCGEFTLDVVSLLCVSCSLNEVIANIHRELAGHITLEKTNKNEGEKFPPLKKSNPKRRESSDERKNIRSGREHKPAPKNK